MIPFLNKNDPHSLTRKGSAFFLCSQRIMHCQKLCHGFFIRYDNFFRRLIPIHCMEHHHAVRNDFLMHIGSAIASKQATCKAQRHHKKQHQNRGCSFFHSVTSFVRFFMILSYVSSFLNVLEPCIRFGKHPVPGSFLAIPPALGYTFFIYVRLILTKGGGPCAFNYPTISPIPN